MRAELGRVQLADAPVAAAVPVPAAPAQRRHLHHVDVVRLLTFVCVIGVHAVPLTTSAGSTAAGAGVVLLHFTRDAFFLLSAYVLVHAYSGRAVRLRDFWRRRFFYIGVPYLTWTVIYWWLHAGARPLGAGDLAALGSDLVFGTGEYHLYFLLVSMQFYLLFPLLLALVRRTVGHHLALLMVSLTMDVAGLALITWRPWPGGWAVLQAHAYALVPTYQFCFVAGAVAAVHHERFAAWVCAHKRWVCAIVVGTGVLQEAAYLARLAGSGSPDQASDPLQPMLIVWSVAVTLGLYSMGLAYAQRRCRGRLSRAVEQASLTSFGVYLVHPLILNGLLARWLSSQAATLPASAATVLAWSITLGLSFGFAALAVRTPLALPLTGRRQLRGRRIGQLWPVSDRSRSSAATRAAR